MAASWAGRRSGHLLCLDKTTTGDGLVSALQVLAIMKQTGAKLAELVAQMPKYPQVLLNVRTPRRIDFKTRPEIAAAVAAAEARLAGTGRIVLRPSGTEPVIRVMAEGQDEALVRSVADELAAVVSAAAAA